MRKSSVFDRCDKERIKQLEEELEKVKNDNDELREELREIKVKEELEELEALFELMRNNVKGGRNVIVTSSMSTGSEIEYNIEFSSSEFLTKSMIRPDKRATSISIDRIKDAREVLSHLVNMEGMFSTSPNSNGKASARLDGAKRIIEALGLSKEVGEC